MADDNGAYSGYLYKWARVMKGWKKRYFVLDKGRLKYYRDADSLQDVRGEMALDTATIELKEKKDFFVLRSPLSSKPWWIKCDDKNLWLQKISRYARTSKPSTPSLGRGPQDPPVGNGSGIRTSPHSNGTTSPPTFSRLPLTPTTATAIPVATTPSPPPPIATTTTKTTKTTKITTQQEEEQSQRRIVNASVTLLYVALLFVFSASDSLKWILVVTILYVIFLYLYAFSSISKVLLDLVSKG